MPQSVMTMTSAPERRRSGRPRARRRISCTASSRRPTVSSGMTVLVGAKAPSRKTLNSKSRRRVLRSGKLQRRQILYATIAVDSEVGHHPAHDFALGRELDVRAGVVDGLQHVAVAWAVELTSDSVKVQKRLSVEITVSRDCLDNPGFLPTLNCLSRPYRGVTRKKTNDFFHLF
ncbi:hypothetical protein BDV95DRAFT_593218 [Massariosphaeria phaeospora]|uniref:Uncharacterized protein n=1 Tax=Massariosphaeria phaeospora TaxID=100035 RepID=A0A7C8I7U3_9PLEO|nr:hypothetical protein BDV95DRAFT_593218 [Massariosphaeria phaeospora]